MSGGEGEFSDQMWKQRNKICQAHMLGFFKYTVIKKALFLVQAPGDRIKPADELSSPVVWWNLTQISFTLLRLVTILHSPVLCFNSFIGMQFYEWQEFPEMSCLDISV